MKAKYYFLVLAAAVFFFTVQSSAQAPNRNALERMKTEIYRQGTGDKAKVVVTLNDGRKLKGSIVRAGDESFELANAKTKQTMAIGYRDVLRVKKPGMSRWAWIAIGVGAGVAVTIAMVAVAVKNAFPDISIGRPPR